jgi:hypothetical protein
MDIDMAVISAGEVTSNGRNNSIDATVKNISAAISLVPT